MLSSKSRSRDRHGVVFMDWFFLSDDGKLSLEEFQSYFADGILTDDQMQELYYSIDRQQTG